MPKRATAPVPIHPDEPTIQLIELADIRRPQAQRIVSQGWADSIVREFDVRLLDLLIVSRRVWNGNELHGIDDGHRVRALLDMGYTHAWARIIDTNNLDDEARLMVLLNSRRRRYAPADAHKALYEVDYPDAVLIEDLITPFGSTFLPDRPNQVGGVAMFYDPQLKGRNGLIHLRGMGNNTGRITRVFTLLNSGWGSPHGTQQWMRKDIVPGLFELMARAQQHVTDKHVLDALARWTMTEVINQSGLMHGASARNQSRARWATAWAEHIYPDPKSKESQTVAAFLAYPYSQSYLNGDLK